MKISIKNSSEDLKKNVRITLRLNKDGLFSPSLLHLFNPHVYTLKLFVITAVQSGPHFIEEILSSNDQFTKIGKQLKNLQSYLMRLVISLDVYLCNKLYHYNCQYDVQCIHLQSSDYIFDEIIIKYC